MATINHHDREISLKIVYYGPGLGGKTSSLQALHHSLNPQRRGQLVSLATGSDRTLYFDFLPVRAKVQHLNVRLQLYTVPGQVHYNSTRKLVLSGADAIVLVADSQRARMGANIESLANLKENLLEQGRAIDDLPLVLQYNKRDVPDALAIAEMQAALNPRNGPYFETIATTGKGVFDALKKISLLTLRQLQLEGKAHAPTHTAPDVPTAAHKTDDASSDSSPLAASVQHLTEELAQMAPQTHKSGSGAYAIQSKPTGRTFAHLSHGVCQSAIALVEHDIDQSNWEAAVRHASAGLHRLAVEFAGRNADSPTEAAATLALMLNLPFSWLQRFREIEQRVLGGAGGVSSEDAMFCLLWLTCAALRAHEQPAT